MHSLILSHTYIHTYTSACLGYEEGCPRRRDEDSRSHRRFSRVWLCMQPVREGKRKKKGKKQEQGAREEAWDCECFTVDFMN